MPRAPAFSAEDRATAASAVLAGATLATAGALVGADKATVSRWLTEGRAALPAALDARFTTPERETIALVYLQGAERAAAKLGELVEKANTAAEIRDVAYAMRVQAQVALDIMGWRAQSNVYVGGQHLHAGPAAPLGEIDDAELERRIAAAAAIREPAP